MRPTVMIMLAALALTLVGCGATEADRALEQAQTEIEELRGLVMQNTEDVAELIANKQLEDEYNDRAWAATWRWIDERLEEDNAE